MAHKLADELLKEILSPPLLVPDELFADSGPVSPFSKTTSSAADVLLVCKRWMRVATPALYHTVIIRSMAQAQALADALHSNPVFGQYIKKLRIEGAYGSHLAKIAPVSPNITDFCFTLTIWTDVSNAGLLKLLSAINPTRVIITTSHRKTIRNKKLTQVVDKLCSSIPLWTELEVFHFSGSDTDPSLEIERHPAIANALSVSTSLRAVHLWRSPWSSVPPSLVALASNTNIRAFHWHSIYDPHCSVAKILSKLPECMHSRTLVRFSQSAATRGTEPSRGPTPQDMFDMNPFYVPMSNVPDSLRMRVWSLILEFAIQKSTSMWVRG